MNLRTTLRQPGGWLVLASVLLFLALVARFWHPVYGFTSLFQLDASNDDLKLAALRENPVWVYRDTGGYDGLYYAQLALDPTLRDPALPRAMDNFSYRARRILPPALAWVLGAGQPAAVLGAYALINVLAWLALAWLLWQLVALSGEPHLREPTAPATPVDSGRRWLAWAGVLFSAGALSSVRLALTDLPALTIIAAAVYAAECWRGRFAVALLSAAGLARETSFLAVAGLCKARWLSLKNLARLLLVALPLAAWLGYVRWRVGPADPGWGNFTWPVAGFVEKWRAVIAAAAHHEDRVLAWTTLLAVAGITAQLAFFATRLRLTDRWWRIGAAYTVMALCLGTAVWEGFPGAATRVLLPLTLAFNIVACRSRAALPWLLIGNLGVFSGLLALRDVPRDPAEIAAYRSGRIAAVARLGDGWYGREMAGHHVWAWSAHRAGVTLETWPKATPTAVGLEFRLRGMAPCTVRVEQAGREIARFEATAQLAPQHLVVNVTGGYAAIEFVTDVAPHPESAAPNARPLAFAIYDLRVTSGPVPVPPSPR